MEDERIVRKEDVTAGYAQKIGAIAESLQQYMNIKVYVCDLFSAMMRETANRGDRSRFYEKNDGWYPTNKLVVTLTFPQIYTSTVMDIGFFTKN